MSSSSGLGAINNQPASSSTSSAKQPDDSTTHNENSNKQSTSQVPQHRPVNNERDAGASTSYNFAETQVTQHSMQHPLTLTNMGEQYQLILDAQTSAPSATYARSPAQLPTDDDTSILCNLDFPQATAPELPPDLEDIPKTQLMRLQPIGDPSESPPKPHTCPSCNVVCGDLEALRRHAEVHDEDNGLFPCDECELVCADAEARERHAEEHTYRLTCSSCNKRFALNEHLAAHACTSGVDAENQHARTQKFNHPPEETKRPEAPPFVRALAAGSSGDATTTTRRASEAGQFGGDVVRLGCRWPGCGKTFAYTVNLTRHMKSHTNEKEFVCRFCGREFMRSDTRARHVKRKHKDADEDEDDEDQL